ncbi:2OG-Fe(II) oxygenase [Pseudoalteromonas piscicida]|uniref:2OG-Fe(II) oxygenase n=1 Tax=Pseudoalteromonas piscicida TaxID=43662 RepID=UPI001C988662|nr:2OG-Fe(II) oxygenase [Pseudoalteromonas piscicida]QZO15159.1 2OG-Fe(II) oxygenase [Pseudoalteromonas piscicida]
MESKPKYFRWQFGRQQSGYQKMLLATAMWPVKFDMYLLKFPTGCEVPPHTDKVVSGKHFRLNIVLKRAKLGGEFKCKDPLYSSSRIKLFRPDKSEHSVSKVEAGTRVLLSIGWVR